jgi:hypothetical protein
VQLLEAGVRILPHELLGQLHLDAQRHEPLLRAVMQVALDPPPLPVGGREDAGARFPHVVQRRLDLRDEALVLERDPGIGRGRVDQVLLIVERLVVDDGGDPPVAVGHLGHALPGPRRGQLDRPPFGVHPAATVQRDPVGEPKRGVVERLRQSVPQPGWVQAGVQPQPEGLERVGGEEPSA